MLYFGCWKPLDAHQSSAPTYYTLTPYIKQISRETSLSRRPYLTYLLRLCNMAIDLVNLTVFDEIVPHLTSVEVILQRAFDEQPFLPLDVVSRAIKSPRFLRRKRTISKRDIMEDIVATYSNVFGTKSLPGKWVISSPAFFLAYSTFSHKALRL